MPGKNGGIIGTGTLEELIRNPKSVTGAWLGGSENLYLIYEPTTGLHPVDLENFLKLLDKLVEMGNTVIVVEHNQQLIMESEWMIDLGLREE